jgi:hypothetical protein
MKARWVLGSLLAASALLHTGARAAKSEREFKDYLYDAEAQRVSFQVCLPKRTNFFDTISVDVTDMPENTDLAEVSKLFAAARKSGGADTSPPKGGDRVYQTIREWRAPKSQTDYPKHFITSGSIYNDGTTTSDTHAPINLSDTTEKDQPVFYSFTFYRPKDVVAVHVSILVVRGGSEQLRTFWFRLPTNIVRGTYTDWIAPVSEETRNGSPSISFLMTHGEELPLYEVGENAPRMRFTLMSLKEDSAQSKTVLRARYAAQLERVKVGRSSVPGEDALFVAERRQSISACGE